METLTLVRSYLEDRTVGFMNLPDGSYLRTLERPYKDNRQNESCIPEGEYIVKRDQHGKYQWYAVQDVRGRSAIEFHEGNYVYNSVGCILVGLEHNDYYDLVHSIPACKKMVSIIGEDSFRLVIRAFNPMTDSWV